MNPPTTTGIAPILRTLAGIMLLVGTPLSLSGCASPAASDPRPLALSRAEPSPARISDPATTGASTESTSTSPDRSAVVNGRVVAWDTLRPGLIELGGRVVLEEIALGRMLERAAARSGITVTDGMIQGEEDALLDELTGVAPGDSRFELLEAVRRSRGLGPTRYRSLLIRNAILRALVAEQAEPSEQELALAEVVSFGPAYRVRLLTGSSDAVSRARALILEADAGARRWVFADLCATTSTHPTADQGGLVRRFSASDPAYPDVIRDAVRDTEPGGVSPVLATAGGFAIVLVESALPASSPGEMDRERVRRRVRIRKERLAMESLARELLLKAQVSPIDPDLADAWRGR